MSGPSTSPTGSFTERPRPIISVMFVLAGPIVWAAHFMSIYFAQSTACTLGAAHSNIMLLEGGLTMAAIAILAGTWLWLRPDTREEELRRYVPVARWLIALAMLAVIWSAFALMMLHACQPAGG